MSSDFVSLQRRLIQSAAALVLLIIATLVGVMIAGSAGLLRPAFIRFVSWQSGRPIDVRGALHLHLWTTSPRIEAEQITIGNPPWTEPGNTAVVGKLIVTFAPLLGRETGLSLLQIDDAQLQFKRDGAGHANWQRVDPDRSPGGPLPMIRALRLTHTHLALLDERLHLAYDGDLSVEGPDSGEALQMGGSGTLNQRPVTFRLKGDALPSAAPDKPYAFEFDERSSGAHFVAHGSLPRPFDLGLVDAQFDATGADLRDLYHLLGVSLPNTGAFHLEGRLVRRDSDTRFDDLTVVSGESDVKGRVTVSTQPGGRTLVHADLNSVQLRSADVGLRAAGRDPHPDAPPELFSPVRVITPATRRVDTVGKLSVRRLLLSKVEVTELSAPFRIERGLIKAPEVTGRVMGGTFRLNLDADANQTPAHDRIVLTLTGLQLAQMPHKGDPPPFDGALSLQLRVQGTGDSLHALAAGADGTLSMHVLQGTMRASLAELASVDLRGLGLALGGSGREVAVRCAGTDFDIHAGVMHATRFFIDSEPVFIRGEGRVLLDTEMLDLKLHGEPKRLRILRIKGPVLVRGTLLQPKFSVDVAESGLRLVDRGTPQNADCAGR